MKSKKKKRTSNGMFHHVGKSLEKLHLKEIEKPMQLGGQLELLCNLEIQLESRKVIEIGISGH